MPVGPESRMRSRQVRRIPRGRLGSPGTRSRAGTRTGVGVLPAKGPHVRPGRGRRTVTDRARWGAPLSAIIMTRMRSRSIDSERCPLPVLASLNSCQLGDET